MPTDQTPTSAATPPDAAALIEQYYERGWTDGLPVVPPTEELVARTLACAGLTGSEVLAEIPQRNARITADKVAVNVVLAGCKPEYMPVVAAAVQGLGTPEFGFHHVVAATSGPSIGVIVNGPIVAQLGINARDNLLGQGFRPNATIGRALRLVIMNVTNSRPGGLDRGTLGSPGRYTLCFAENEADSPWAPLHVERGFAAEQSTVTLACCNSFLQVFNTISRSPEPLLHSVADAMSYLGSLGLMWQTPGVVIFAGEHTKVLRDSGWSKDRVREFIVAHARRTVADLKAAGRLPEEAAPGDEETWQYAMDNPADLIVLCGGGETGGWTACLPGFGSSPLAGRSPTLPVVTP